MVWLVGWYVECSLVGLRGASAGSAYTEGGDTALKGVQQRSPTQLLLCLVPLLSENCMCSTLYPRGSLHTQLESFECYSYQNSLRQHTAATTSKSQTLCSGLGFRFRV
jgi:hypothetical protein